MDSIRDDWKAVAADKRETVTHAFLTPRFWFIIVSVLFSQTEKNVCVNKQYIQN